ncbi:MAG: RluA family pseudouridine synthase [Anaerolineae bacterium]|nr:RluA family pseudouridine synthase [Anaerolineae bacterium]
MYTLAVEIPGDRLDRFVAEALPDLSRMMVKRLIETGQISVNGTLTRVAYKTRVGDKIVVQVPSPQLTEIVPEVLPLDILYEDKDIVVLNKAAGMVVHPGAGNRSGTLVNALLAHCPDLEGIGGEVRPGIVHRLDKDTSGVLVVAKHDRAIRALQAQFKQRTVRKVYVALLEGRLPQETGLIEAPIGRHPVHRKKMAVVAKGKVARTRWQIQSVYYDNENHPYTLVNIDLLTGRTHQIRVHFSWLGYPLVGDRVYGPSHPVLEISRQFLHARDLTLKHPTIEKEMTFSAPLPEDLLVVLQRLTET